MIEILYYIHTKGMRYPNYDLFRTNSLFVILLSYVFFVPTFYILYKLDYYDFLNWFKYFDDSPIIRMIVIPLIILSVFCYFKYFRRDKRLCILNKYEGRYKILIKYSFIIYVLFLLIPSLLTVFLVNIFL